MTYALARSLLLANAVTPSALARALFLSATQGTSLVAALLATRAVDPARLQDLLEAGRALSTGHVVPLMFLVDQLPAGLCERLLALPVRRDDVTGTVDVAVADASDPHPAEEIAYWLRAPVRVVRASIDSMGAAIRCIPATVGDGARDPAPPPAVSAAGPVRRATLGYGLPALDATTARLATGVVADVPFPLTRRLVAPSIGAVAPAASGSQEDAVDPVIDLKRRKAEPSPPTAPSDDPPESSRPSVVTERGPFVPSTSQPPFDTIRLVIEEIRTAHDRDRVLELLTAGVRRVARRVAVFAVRRDSLIGWTCSPEAADRAALRGVRLPMSPPTVVHEALGRRGAWLTVLPRDAALAPLIAVLRAPPAGEAALVAVHVEDKAVAVVLADGLTDTGVATRLMSDLAAASGASLARLLRERRK